MFRITTLAAAVLAWTSCAAAEPGLHAPRLGCVSDSQNSLRALWGIRGNFVLGEAIASAVESAACSQTHALVKTATAILTMDSGGTVLARQEAAPGTAQFAFHPDGTPAYLFLTAARQVLQWTGQQWVANDWSWQGETLHIAAAAGGSLLVLVRQDEELLLAKASGSEWAVLQRIPSRAQAALLLADGSLLLVEDGAVRLLRPDGSSQPVDTPAPARALSPLGSGWIRIALDGMDLAMEGTRLETWFLPKPAAPEAP